MRRQRKGSFARRRNDFGYDFFGIRRRIAIGLFAAQTDDLRQRAEIVIAFHFRFPRFVARIHRFYNVNASRWVAET